MRQTDRYQLDIETNVTPWWCDKKLITLQFGELDGTYQWVVQWSCLGARERLELKLMLEDHTKIKVGHNLMFECVVLLFHNIRITNLYDIMLAEMILNCGTEFQSEWIEDDERDEAAGFYALTAVAYRYLGHGMDKTEQMNFGDDVLTESKVIYAANDVKILGGIRAMQMLTLASQDLEFVAGLEMDALPAFAEMTYYGMPLDQTKWKENEEMAAPVIAKAKADLDEFLMGTEPFRTYALAKGYFSEQDRIVVNWNSPPQKKRIVEHYFPFLQDRHSKAVLEKLIRDGLFSDPKGLEIASAFYLGNWKLIEDIMVEADKAWLIDNYFLIPAQQATINWGSWQQVLPLFKLVKKNLHSLNEQSMDNFHHPISVAYVKYKEMLKLITTYGMQFITGKPNPKRPQDMPKVEPDGIVRTSFNQIVSTGRVSSRRPNMQNIPVENVGTRYRNAFVCDPWEVYVSSDFTGQELAIIAYLSQDPVWLRCQQTGEDIHSVASELVFPNKQWLKAAEPGCAYYKQGPDGKPLHYKCKCKKHEALRYKVKRLNFGLAYGMGPGKLSGMIKTTFREAEALIEQYFKVFPKIGQMLNYLGRYGVRNGYITTLAPFFRKRWFPKWQYSQAQIPLHLSGQYDPQLGSIEREAKNMPIQGSGGDMCKVAAVLIYDKIHENAYPVKLRMQVHDQLDTTCDPEFAWEWSRIQDDLMQEAALLIIPNGLLKSDTNITPVWSK